MSGFVLTSIHIAKSAAIPYFLFGLCLATGDVRLLGKLRICVCVYAGVSDERRRDRKGGGRRETRE